MEKLKESKIIEIKDFDNTYKFRIFLFDVDTGLDFFLKMFEKDGLDKEKIDMLLKQAILLQDKEELNQKFSYEMATSIFRNPFTIMNLAVKIKEFQDVFTKDFKI